MAKAKISAKTGKIDYTKIILVCVLLILIGFAVVYIFNITKLSKAMESYQNGAASYQVVYVYSSQCPHCTEFAPTFDQLTNTQQSQDNIQFLKYEYRDADAQKHMKYVDGFPTVLFYSSADVDDVYAFQGKSTGNQSINALQTNMQQYFAL